MTPGIGPSTDPSPVPTVTRMVILVVALLALTACSADRPRATEAPTSSTTSAIEPADTDASEVPSAPEATTDTGSTIVPVTPGPAPLDSVRIGFTIIARVPQPLDLVAGPDSALYVASKTGVVFRIGPGGPPEEWLNIGDRVSTEGERGLLGVAFGPRGRFYASFTDLEGNSRVSSWSVEGGRVDPGSEAEVISVTQPFANHNGGHIEFGPDAMLYLGLGDGGSGYDPLGSGQDTTTLLGSIVRIDPTPVTGGYRIPPDNPFTDHPEIVAPEIWVFGVRNPWRFSFDSETGDLWIGDVGQDHIEEIDRLNAGPDTIVGGRGANLGWGVLEGGEVIGDPGDLVSEPIPPVHTYDHDSGVSVTGGRVYHGSSVPDLEGVYLFADFGSGTLWGLRPGLGGRELSVLASDVGSVAGFGVDGAGEMYLLDLGGSVLKIVAAD